MSTVKRLDVINRLTEAGISLEDAVALRRIAATLRRWFEMECGSDSGAIERDEATGKPFQIGWYRNGTKYQFPIRDRETGARKRLAQIMDRYPSLRAYVQGDPRGPSLYIARPGDIPDGAQIDSYYTNGIAVY
jgi:hypothetical protein